MAENNFVLKLGNNSDIIAELHKFAEEQGIDYGFIESGMGRIKDFELILHGPRASVSRLDTKDVFEINSISGNMQKAKGGMLQLSLKAAVSRTGFTSKIGQLIRAKAAGTVEISVRKVNLKKIILA